MFYRTDAPNYQQIFFAFGMFLERSRTSKTLYTDKKLSMLSVIINDNFIGNQDNEKGANTF